MGWHGKVAWDIYLFYGLAAKWTAAPPKPEFWMHQLRDDWAKKDQYRTGDDLKNGLFVSMEKMGLSIAVGEEKRPVTRGTN